MWGIQQAKQAARAMQAAVDRDPVALPDHVTDAYRWRGAHPFHELHGAGAVRDRLLLPLHRSLTSLQRRETIFIGGQNQHAPEEIWTLSSGTFTGLFDKDFVGIAAHRKAVEIPYAEFHKVTPAGIAETALFLDLIRLQQQVGLDPVPAQTGARLTPPGPLTNDGILLQPQDPAEGEATRDLLDRMMADLMEFNDRGRATCPPDLLRRTWHEDMAWYGPGGIGTALTIPRYQEQHQAPFRTRLDDKVFNGHVCRIAEGAYSGWFGWPNLNNRNAGGFLGLPASDIHAEMRVVDIYRRDGDKLSENWVFIDLLHYAHQHGYDLLADPHALHGLAIDGAEI